MTDSLSRTLSEVTGQIPPLARVAAITDLKHCSYSWHTIDGLHALCGHLERAELEVEVKDRLDVHKAFGGVWNPDLESEKEQLLNTILWEASILSHEEGKCVVTI